MPHIERSLELEASPAQLWQVAADPARFGEWLTLHRSWVGPVPVNPQIGTTSTAVGALIGIPMTLRWTVLRYDAPVAARLRGVGPADIEVTISLDVDAVGTGSRLRVGAQFDGQLVTGPLGPAIEAAGKQELDRSLQRLRTLLTAGRTT